MIISFFVPSVAWSRDSDRNGAQRRSRATPRLGNWELPPDSQSFMPVHAPMFRDSTGLVPQIHLTTGLGYHNLVCSCVCECVDVCARMFHQLVFISHSFGAWFWTETQLPDVCCRFFRPVSTQPKRKRLRLMYQSDKEHCTRHIWYSSQLVTSHSIAVITVTRIHSCNPNGLSRK